MSLNPKTFEEAKSTFKPLKRSEMTRGKGVTRKTAPAQSARKRARSKKRAEREKLPTRKKLVAELHKTVSLIVRLRDKQCVICGTKERLQCGHIFGRRSHGAAFDITLDGNCHTQCDGCNKKHNQRPWIYYKWYIERFGQEAFDEMYRRWEKGHKYSRRELIELLAGHQAVLSTMEASYVDLLPADRKALQHSLPESVDTNRV